MITDINAIYSKAVEIIPWLKKKAGKISEVNLKSAIQVRFKDKIDYDKYVLALENLEIDGIIFRNTGGMLDLL